VVTFQSSIWQRLGYLALVMLPWLLSGRAQIWTVIWVTLVTSVAGTLLAIAFNAMFAAVVPPEWRAHLVGRRNALVSLSLMGTALLCGLILDEVRFPLNYQIVFGIGALGALMSSFHLGRIRSEGKPPPLRWQGLGGLVQPVKLGNLRQAVRRGLQAETNGKPLLRLDLLRGPFGLFLAAYFSFYAFQYAGQPIFPLFNVNVLKLSDGAISLGTALFHGMVMLASLWLGKATARLGHRRILAISAVVFAQYPLVLAFATDAKLFLVVSVTGGLVFAFLNGALFNRLMERVPTEDMPAHMALHNLALNLGILVGSLLGSGLSEWLGPGQALLVVAGLRVLAGLFLVWAG
jgi:predicted MFS family arabinose efflux permease